MYLLLCKPIMFGTFTGYQMTEHCFYSHGLILLKHTSQIRGIRDLETKPVHSCIEFDMHRELLYPLLPEIMMKCMVDRERIYFGFQMIGYQCIKCCFICIHYHDR